jgi:Na+/H+ antiporter NhaD/arsenite permease-like protein
MSAGGMVSAPILRRIATFAKKDAVLIIALACACVSSIFVPISLSYLEYIDWKVLSCLFCLMAVVAGLRGLGVFDIAAVATSRFASGARKIGLILIGLTFFLSMAITNDVALITLVPFSLIMLKNVARARTRMTVIALQTIAANVGSSLTPVGNPQNLYLFSHYGMDASAFFSGIFPIVGVGGALLVAAVFTIPNEPVRNDIGSHNHAFRAIPACVYAVLFTAAVLSVFRILPFIPVTIAVIAAVIIMDRKILLRVDYSLLLTFVGFFIFIGNLQSIESIREFLVTLSSGDITLVSAVASQFISNVPAALLFSRFTDDPVGLLRGVSIGGLGTLIASLASVISYKFFCAERKEESLAYLGVFTVWNVGFLAVLYAVQRLL